MQDKPTPEEAQLIQAAITHQALPSIWLLEFDERQTRLIQNCRTYASSDPAGLPGHQLMLTIAKMAQLLDDR